MNKNQVLFIVGLLFAIIITVFAMINSKTVEINFLFTKLKASLALVVLLSAAFGAIGAGLLGLFRRVGLSSELRSVRKQNEKLMNQIKYAEDTKIDNHGKAKDENKAQEREEKAETKDEPIKEIVDEEEKESE